MCSKPCDLEEPIIAGGPWEYHIALGNIAQIYEYETAYGRNRPYSEGTGSRYYFAYVYGVLRAFGRGRRL